MAVVTLGCHKRNFLLSDGICILRFLKPIPSTMTRLFAVVALLLMFAAPLALADGDRTGGDPPSRSVSTVPPGDILD
jgi:hypothetical protein